MTKYEVISGNTNQTAPSYICSQTEFTQTTDAPDGSALAVVDTTTHAVVCYYVAYDGYWNTL